MRSDTIASLVLVETMLGLALVLLVLLAGVWLALSSRPHHCGGPYGIPGGLERWQHGSYRWRRGLEAAALVTVTAVTMPWTVEIVVGAGPAVGLLWLAWPRRRHPGLVE